VIVESTTTRKTTTATIPMVSTSLLPTDGLDLVYDLSTIPLQTVEHFEFIDKNPGSSTIIGGIAVAEEDSDFHWWDLDEASFSPLSEPSKSPLPITSTMRLSHIDEDDWSIFNTTSIPLTTRFEHLLADEDTENNVEEINETADELFTFDSEANSEIGLNMNDYFLSPTSPTVDLLTNNTQTFIPYYFTDYKTDEQLIDLVKPVPTLAMPPFSWMIHLANQNKSLIKSRQSLANTSSTNPPKMKKKKKNTKRKVQLKPKISQSLDHFYDYCHKKQCQHGGRVNSDCLCICLPAFTGDHCEIGKEIELFEGNIISF
jgi:hypothetical protein